MPTTAAGIKVTTMNYVIIYTHDMSKACDFYKNILGMQIKMQSPEWTEIETGTTTLALHLSDKPVAKQCEQTAPLMVFGVENVHEAYSQLKSKGLNIKEPQKVCENPEGTKAGFSFDFSDPDGNHLSIFSYVPIEKA